MNTKYPFPQPETATAVLVFLFSLLWCFSMSGCSVTERADNNPKLQKKIFDYAIEKGICAPDTTGVIEIVKDTIIYRDTTITDTIQVPSEQVVVNDSLIYIYKDFSVTTKNGIRVTVKNGQVTAYATHKCQDKYYKVTKTYTVADTKMQQLLLGQLSSAQTSEKSWKSKAQTRFWVAISGWILALILLIALIYIIFFKKK